MKKCKYCGREIPASSTKCSHCGKLLHDGQHHHKKKHHHTKKIVRKVKRFKKRKLLVFLIDFVILAVFLTLFGISKLILNNNAGGLSYGSYSVAAFEDKTHFMKKYQNLFKDIYNEEDSDLDKYKKLYRKLYSFDITKGDLVEFSLIKSKMAKLKKKITFEDYENSYNLPEAGVREDSMYFLQNIWQKRFERVKSDLDYLLALDNEEEMKNRTEKYGKCPHCLGSGIDPEETNIYSMPDPGTSEYESVGRTPDSCCLCYGAGYNIPHEFYEELFDYETEFNKLLYLIEADSKGLKFMHDPSKKKPVQWW